MRALLVVLWLLPGLSQALNRPCREVIAGRSDAGVVRLSHRAPARLRELYRSIVAPVLREGHREDLDTTDVQFSGPSNAVLVSSPIGRFSLSLVGNDSEIYPTEGVPEFVSDGTLLYGQMRLPVDLDRWDVARYQGWFRSLVRGDPYLSPTRRHPDWSATEPSIPNYPQEAGLAGLIELEDSENIEAKSRRGLVMGVGGGKTIVSAHYSDRLFAELKRRGHPAWQKPPFLLFNIQNGFVLARARTTQARELRIAETQIQAIYGKELAGFNGILPETRLGLITRTSLLRRFADIEAWLIRDPFQSFVIILDEAQHIGKDPGEFKQILDGLERLLSNPDFAARVRVLLLSATPWHKDRAIIRDWLKGNIVVPMLNAPELERMKQGQDLLPLARALYIRETEQGYTAPSSHIDILSNLAGMDTSRLLCYPAESAEAKPLMKDVRDKILARRRPHVYDRVLIYSPDITQANAHVRVLKRLLGEDVRALHSNTANRTGTFDWFSDSEPRHKYLVVVDMFNEGVDVGAINGLVLLANHGSNGFAAFAPFMHRWGRAARTWDFKGDFWIIDPTSASRWLSDGLSRVMVEPDPQRSGSRPQTVTVNGTPLKPGALKWEVTRFFPGDSDFLARHPLFDFQVFTQKTLPLLHEMAKAFGFTPVKSEYGGMKLALRLAEGLESWGDGEELYSQLSDLNYWHWEKTDGGMIFNSYQKEAVYRFYDALFSIAAVIKMTPEGDHLDIEKLHEPENMRELRRLLFPERRSLLDLETVKEFLDPQSGAFAVVEEEWDFRDLPGINRDSRRLGDFFAEAAERLPQTIRRDRCIEDFKARWDWSASDTRLHYALKYPLPQGPLNSEGVLDLQRRPFQRIYRALYALAYLAREAGYAIDPARIHTRAEAERLMAVLYPDAIRVSATSDEIMTFRDVEQGAFSLLVQRQPLMNITDWRTNYGPKRAALFLLGQIETHGEERFENRRSELRAILESQDYGWKSDDGFKMNKGNNTHDARKFLRALKAICQLQKDITQAPQLNAALIGQRVQMSYLLDTLTVGRELPSLSQKIWGEFIHDTQGANSALAAQGRRFGFPSWQRDSAAGKTLKRMLESPAFERVDVSKARAMVERWGFGADDGTACKDGYAAAERMYRALVLIATLAQNCPRGETIDLKTVHTAQGFQKLLTVLYPEQANETPFESLIPQFVDKRAGAVAALIERASLLEVRRFVDQHGARDSVLNLLKNVDVGQNRELRLEKEQLHKDLKAMPWSLVDGAMILAGKPMACARYYQALTATIDLYNRAHPDRTVDLGKITSRQAMGTAVDLILFGFEIPELDSERVSEFRGETGALVALLHAFTAAELTHFNTDHGPKRFLLNHLRPADQRLKIAKRVYAFLNNDALWGWKATDGSTALKQAVYAANFRIFRAIYVRAKLAAAEGRLSEESLKDLQKGVPAQAFFAALAP